MHKQKQKNWIKRIMLLITFSLVLVVSSPQIVNYNASNGEDSYTAHAVGSSTSAAKTTKVMERVDAIMEVQAFFNKLLWPVLYMIGGLMDNSLLFGGGMGAKLRDIWVPIRNIVNIFFVIALVGIALYNILGIGEDGGTTAIKTALPKIIVGIIAVNFSFLGIKVALDAVNIVTTAIFALPNEVGDSKIFEDDQSKDGYASSVKIQEGICLNLAETTASKANGSSESDRFSNVKLNGMAKTSAYKRIAQKYGVSFKPKDDAADIKNAGRSLSPSPTQKLFQGELDKYKAICNGRVLSDEGKAYFEKFKSNNAALAMATNMLHMTFLPSTDLANIKDLDDIGVLAVNALFGLVMYILFAASFVALLIVLLARLVVMWLSIVVSPLLIVAMAIPSLKEQLGAIGKISEQFVKHLIVPIPIALSLSIGWIMLRVIQKQNFTNLIAQGTDVTLGIPVVGMSTLQELVTVVGCIAIIWMGVFSSAEGTLAEGMTGWIKDKLAAGGKFLGSAPFKYIPWIPIGGKNYTLGSVKTFVDELQNKANARDTSLVNSDLGKMFHLATTTTVDDLKTERNPDKYVAGLKSTAILEKIRTGTLSPKDLQRTREVIQGMKSDGLKYGNLIKALDAYSAAGDDKDKRKKAGKAIYDALNRGELYKISKATPKAAKTSSATDPKQKPGKKTVPPTHVPKKEDQGFAEFTTAKGEKRVVNYNGTKIGKWDERTGTFTPDTSVNTPENKDSIAAAKAVAAKREPLMQARLRAKEKGFDGGLIQEAGGKAGQLLADDNGTIILTVKKGEEYYVDPETGGLKKLTSVELKNKRNGVVNVESVESNGKMTIKTPSSIKDKAKTAINKLQATTKKTKISQSNPQ